MSTTTRAMGCAAIAVLAVSTGCGSDDAADQDPEVSVPSEIAPELASEVELAGTLQLDDLTPPSDGDPWEPWDGAAAETAVASCSVADSSEASTVSEVFASSDDRGPTSVFVTAHSETLVLLTADAASEAFAQIDEDWFADCIVATSAAAHEAYAADAEADDLDEEEYSLYYGAPLEPGDVEVDEASAPDLGDESVALTAEFDVYEGEQVPDGKRSLALRLEFRAPDRTLTDAEVAAVRKEIVAALGAIGAELRG